MIKIRSIRRAPSPKTSLLLVHPSQQGLMEGFSAGLISLANYVVDREPAMDVRIVDLGRADGPESVRQLTSALNGTYRDVIVGISTTTASYQAALSVARTMKQLRPDAYVVLGGHHATPEADVVLTHHRDVDAVIAGEGEAALLALARNYPSIASVPNMAFRGGCGLVRNPTAPLLDQETLDSIGPTLRGGSLRSAPGKFSHATYVSARGCPLHCLFCAVANERIRTKTTPRVIGDLRRLAVDHGYRSIAIEDNFFAHSITRTRELCTALTELRRDVPFAWDCQTRVESLARPGIVEAMANAGCEAVYIGVEALHPELLTYLEKTHVPEKYLRTLVDVVVPRLLASTIDCYINLQFGIPGETRVHQEFFLETLAQLGRAAARQGRKITIFPQLAVLYPGTGHFTVALRERRFGRETREIFEAFTLWESQCQPVLRWMGETFAHGTGGIPEGILEPAPRNGSFHVDGVAVLRLREQLSAVESLPGIKLFKYGAYLARTEAVSGERPAYVEHRR